KDDSAAFSSAKCGFALVTWSSDSAGTLNIGSGYVTSPVSDDLTINQCSGDPFAASYYYTITKSHYLVPVTGIYIISAVVAYLNAAVEADTYYQCIPTRNGSALVLPTSHTSVAAQPIRPSFAGIFSLTAGDFITLIARSGATGNQTIDDAYTLLQIALFPAQ
ncbi:hypothetical protein MUP77_00545, partial [Candidatus Bathyarchaeota archaeon]|nr:hypothetical protein [Candidatus Bathyarchaeota archaeon]